MFRRRIKHIMPPLPPPDAPAFVFLPIACLPPPVVAAWLSQQALYEWAFAEARAVVRPSLPERDLLGVWN